jgi:hypothetical protein
MAEQIKPTLKDFLVIHPGPWAHGVALRAGISMLVPLLVLVAMGRPEWSAYAAFGAFASLYGRNHIHLSRAVMQASAGALLTVSVVAGVLVGNLASRAWVAVSVAAVVAVLGSLIAASRTGIRRDRCSSSLRSAPSRRFRTPSPTSRSQRASPAAARCSRYS